MNKEGAFLVPSLVKGRVREGFYGLAGVRYITIL